MQLEQKKSAENDQALGRSRGGFSTKVHIAVDEDGKPVRLILTGGEAHDITQAEELTCQHHAHNVIADKAYDSDRFVKAIEDSGATAVIPPKADRLVKRKYDKRRYKHRNKVERFVSRIKHFRRAATRYEKTACNFLAFWCIAATMVLIH